MKRMFSLLCLAVLFIAQPVTADPRIPRLSFDDTRWLTPFASGSWDNSLSASINPAAIRFTHDPELIYAHSRYPGNAPSGWGLYTGLKPYGFSVTSRQVPIQTASGGPGNETIRDYRFSIGTGSRAFALGMAYGWSGGPADLRPDGFFSAGVIVRPSRFLSVGLTGVPSGPKRTREALADLSIRPFGASGLTLFADASMSGADSPDEAAWSAGACLEPLPGIRVAAKYGDGKRFMLGGSFSLGFLTAGSAGGWKGGTGSPASHTFIRVGAPERNIGDRTWRKGKSFLSLDLNGRIAYRKYRFFDSKTASLSGILDALRKAADDPAVAGVAVNLSGAGFAEEYAGRAGLSELGWEIREALLGFRKTGKRAVAFLDEADMNAYYIASAADRVVLDPEGILQIEGFAIGKTYMRGLLDKLGVGVEELRFFTYKSAAETMARKEMSEADREQLEAYLEDCYSLARRDVSASRGFSEAVFDSLVDRVVIFTPKEAKQAGLVDTLARWSDAEKIVEKTEGGPKRFVRPSGLAGNVYPDDRWGALPKIALVYALGPCDIETGIQGRKLEKIIRGLAKDRSVKAVVLRADSPGGSALASDLVAEAMKECRKEKPVIVSQGAVAGSGGYWISMYGDTIVSSPLTITGSVGVISMWVWNAGLGDKIGLRSDIVQAGRHADLTRGILLPIADAVLPDRALSPEERARYESVIRDLYAGFVAKVAEGRGMRPSAVDSVGQGRIWSGTDAKERGLVDAIGGMERAIEIAAEKAGLRPEQGIRVKELPGKEWFDPSMFMPRLIGTRARGAKEDPAVETLRLILERPGRVMPLMPLGLWLGI
ncbi:MAG: S49 family peptidase [bacterium]|nr:S49 family peptidase [bacterium]